MTTIIELFDECPIENVISALKFNPQKLVFVGFKETMTKKKIDDLRRFFEARHMEIEIEYEIVGRYDYSSIVDKLNLIIDRNKDCFFDLTGGKELVLTAMGEVSASRSIPMFQFNVKTGKLIKVKNCDNIYDTDKPTMKINESIILNGGKVITDEEGDFKWELTDDFKKDIEIIWGICKNNCRLWNKHSLIFYSFEKWGEITDDFRVTVNLAKMKENGHEIFLNSGIISSLIKNKIFLDYSYENNILSFRYKNKQVHECISKAGNILELYVYMLTNEINQKYPNSYDDIDISVYVDWDGITYDGQNSEKDTKNEIDVMVTKGLVPIFISCKNGEVQKSALYELKTVADYFGGEYAKMVLVTSYISIDDESKEYIIKRAEDMNITVIDGVDKLTRDEFISVLKEKVK